MLDLAIGTKFHCEGKVIEVVEDLGESENPCYECFFYFKEAESYFNYIPYCDMVKCRPCPAVTNPCHGRYDNKSVIFKEVKE